MTKNNIKAKAVEFILQYSEMIENEWFDTDRRLNGEPIIEFCKFLGLSKNDITEIESNLGRTYVD